MILKQKPFFALVSVFKVIILITLFGLFSAGCQPEYTHLKHLPKKLSDQEIVQLNGKKVSVSHQVRIVGNAPFSQPAFTIQGVDVILEAQTPKLKKFLRNAQGNRVHVKGLLKVKRLVTRNRKVSRLKYAIQIESAVLAQK